MGGMGLIFTPTLVRCLLGPLDFSGPLIELIATPNSPIERYRLPTHPLIHTCSDITVLASY